MPLLQRPTTSPPQSAQQQQLQATIAALRHQEQLQDDYRALGLHLPISSGANCIQVVNDARSRVVASSATSHEVKATPSLHHLSGTSSTPSHVSLSPPQLVVCKAHSGSSCRCQRATSTQPTSTTAGSKLLDCALATDSHVASERRQWHQSTRKCKRCTNNDTIPLTTVGAGNADSTRRCAPIDTNEPDSVACAATPSTPNRISIARSLISAHSQQRATARGITSVQTSTTGAASDALR